MTEGDTGEWRTGTPSLRNEVAADVSGSVVQAGIVHGGIHLRTAAPGTGYPAVPAQLPASRPYFTDRVREMGVLGRLSDSVRDGGTPGVMVISGVGGVGKTSVALAWLHAIADGFADGQLYADLRGFSAGTPAPSSESLGRFLRALGVAPEAVPADVDRMLGRGRTGAEPQAVRSLATLCGRLPLALCTSAARLATPSAFQRLLDHLPLADRSMPRGARARPGGGGAVPAGRRPPR